MARVDGTRDGDLVQQAHVTVADLQRLAEIAREEGHPLWSDTLLRLAHDLAAVTATRHPHTPSETWLSYWLDGRPT